jgi:Ca-activated chloride channel homolog
MKKIWFFLAIAFCVMSFDLLKDITVTGRITSADDGLPLPGVNVILKGTTIGTVTDADGRYQITIPEDGILVFSFIGMTTTEVRANSRTVVDVSLQADVKQLSETVVTGYGQKSHKRGRKDAATGAPAPVEIQTYHHYQESIPQDVEGNTEKYSGISENIFRDAVKEPLSTFSIDVDRASYANIRRFINNGQRPPVDAVRTEELINYFSYDYPQPNGDHPFSVNTEISEAPWNSKHKLVQIGIQGKSVPLDNLPASNLVFLIDVSGSMNQPNKLPLVKQSFGMLTDQLRENDRVSIVVYAGAAGKVLEPTSGADKNKIRQALDRLSAGGSTAGGAGLRLAYTLAKENFREGGNNRVIIATDGDFN